MKIGDFLPKIHSMGNLIFDPIWSEKMHMTHSCELVHIISGHVNVMMGRQKISAGPGDTIIIPSKTMHRDDFDMVSGLEVFSIFFSWKFEKDFFEHVPSATIPRMPEPQKESLASLLQHFRHEFTNSSADNSLPARIHLSEILMKLMASSSDRKVVKNGRLSSTDYGRQRRSWLFEKAKEYLESNYAHPVALEDIAKVLNVSPYHLSHIFSGEGDFSLFEFLIRIRMKKARSLLEEGQLSISEVAYAVGYRNSNYFSKVFHRYFGLPPNQVHKNKISFKKA